MKLNFVISEQYNLIHFVENMSEWSQYTRKQANTFWIESTGPLSDTEKAALSQAKKFFEKYNYDRPVGKYRKIFEFFAVAKESTFEEELRDLVGGEYGKLLVSAMATMSPRFEKIWSTQAPLLDDKKEIILSNLHENDILGDFRILFGGLEIPKAIDVFLVINANKGSSGGANIGPDRITLECSSNKIAEHMLSTFWHEISHLLLRDYVREVFEGIGNDCVSRGFVNEVISHSLFGVFGVLSNKYYFAEDRVKTQKMVDTFVETGEVSDSGRRYIEGLPFGLGHYYLAKFIKRKLDAGESISITKMVDAILAVHSKA